MKFLIAIFCLFFAFTSAQSSETCPQLELLSSGFCNKSSEVPCRNPCVGGEPISGVKNCTAVAYCCLNSENVCVLNQAPAHAVTTQSNGVDAFVMRFGALKNESANATVNEVDAKGLNLGQQGLFCPKFPFTCPIPFLSGYNAYGAQPDISSPVNVPYCQRIACSQSNPFLENDAQACISQPGCYFDQELFTYRSLVGQAILPGVPVCHLAIRNRAFRRRATEVVRQVGPWHPLLTSCVLNEYQSEIFGDFSGCQLLDYLEFFGHKAKRAGWATITERECSLIGACWRRSATENYCAYPANSRGQPIVRSSNDALTSTAARISADIYGLPSCAPFSATAIGAEFLSSYHTCLATGCAVNVDQETIWQHLINAGSNISFPYNLQYISMVYSGQVRPDNYQKVIDEIAHRPQFPFHGSIPSIHSTGFSNIVPLSLSLSNESPSFPFAAAGNTGGNGHPLPGFPIDASAPLFPNLQIPGLAGQVPNGGSYNPYHSLFPSLSVSPVHHNPCPFQSHQLAYPGLPRLTGSFDGCCDQPLCYIPKPDLFNPHSGVSSYLYQWSAWGECSVSCGGGLRNRTRVCVGDYDCDANALLLQTHTCNEHQCPYYSSWGAWSECSATCEGGVKTRSRVCQGTGCQGPAMESSHCRTGKCPTFKHGQWSACSNTCGRGIRTRPLTCTHPGAYRCPPNSVDQEPCVQFCGTSEVECNPTTCCYEETCLQGDGSQGYCAKSESALVGHRCRIGRCLYNFHAVCPRATFGSFNQFQGK